MAKFHGPVALTGIVLESRPGRRDLQYRENSTSPFDWLLCAVWLMSDWLHYVNAVSPFLVFLSRFFLGPNVSDICLWTMRNWHVFTFWSLIFGLLLKSKFKYRHLNTFYRTNTYYWVCLCLKKHMAGTMSTRLPCCFKVFYDYPSWWTGVSPFAPRVIGYLKTPIHSYSEVFLDYRISYG